MRQSKSRFSQFSLDERARVPLHFLSQTIGMAAMWLIMWKVVAPMIGVRVVSSVEAFYNLFWRLFQSVMASFSPSVAVAGSPAGASTVGPAMQFVFNVTVWMFPLLIGLYGVATIWTAIEYGVDRVAGPPAVAEPGGEV